MTYSLIARDEETGELGVAVQSRAFRTGAVCAWARAGVGAVATQSVVEPAYGPNALDRLQDGIGAQQALGELLAADPLAARPAPEFLRARRTILLVQPAAHAHRAAPAARHATVTRPDRSDRDAPQRLA